MTRNAITRFLLLVVSVGTFLIVSVARAQLVLDGLVAYWSFEQNTIEGKNVKDVVGKNHGVEVGSVKYVAGKVGQAIKVDGANSIDIEGTDTLNFAGKKTLSVAAWVNPGDKSPVQGVVAGCCGTIVAQRDALGWALRFDGRNAGQELEFIVDAPVNAWVGDGGFGAAITPVGEWHHLVGTFAEKEMVLYLDGKEIKRGPSGGAAIGSNRSETEIGHAQDGGWIGLIDEVLIYNRELTAKEVAVTFDAKGLPVDSIGKLATTWSSLKTLR
jgi:hypothetical protein